MFELGYIFLAIGLLIDSVSCFLNTRKLIHHEGASGIPGVGLGIYLLVFLWDKDLIVLAKFVDILMFIGIHILLQYGIPSFLSKHQKKAGS